MTPEQSDFLLELRYLNLLRLTHEQLIDLCERAEAISRETA